MGLPQPRRRRLGTAREIRPAGAPESISWHGVLHEIGFAMASVSWLVACFVLLRRFTSDGRRGWAVACVVAPLAWIVVGAWPDLDSLSLRLVVGTAISFAFTAALGVALRPRHRDSGEPSAARSSAKPSSDRAVGQVPEAMKAAGM